MMSERIVKMDATLEVPIGWTEVFKCARELLKQTKASDVRWVHVQRAKGVYESLANLFEEQKMAKKIMAAEQRSK